MEVNLIRHNLIKVTFTHLLCEAKDYWKRQWQSLPLTRDLCNTSHKETYGIPALTPTTRGYAYHVVYVPEMPLLHAMGYSQLGLSLFKCSSAVVTMYKG